MTAQLYLNAIDLLSRSIEKYGSIVTVKQYDETTQTNPLEYSKSYITTTTTAIFKTIEQSRVDDSKILASDSEVVFDNDFKIRHKDFIEKDGKEYKIITLESIKPADVVIGYKAVVRAL